MTSCSLYAMLTLSVLSQFAQAAAPAIKFPSRGDALPAHAVFETSAGAHTQTYGSYTPNGTWAIDLHASRFNASGWVRTKEGATAASSPGGTKVLNEETLVFGAPLYAPIDGSIIACWRTTPDKPDPNTDYDFDGDGIADRSPMVGGNHLQIHTSDNKYAVYLAHLQNRSIPANICPLGDTPDWPSNSVATCNLTDANGNTGDGYRKATLLPNPVPVKKGDFLGRIGHSGASSDPHLHIHVKPLAIDAGADFCQFNSEEIRFVDAYQADRGSGDISPSDWLEFDKTSLASESASDVDLIWADPISPRLHTTVVQGGGRDLHGTVDSSGGVAAYLTGSNTLKLVSFSTNTGQAQIQNELTDNIVKAIDLVRPSDSSRDVIAVVKGDNDLLKLIPFDVTNTGAITRKSGSHAGGRVGPFAAIHSPLPGGVIVALQDSTGALKVNGYSVNVNTLAVSAPGTSGTGGKIRDVAVTPLDKQFAGVATAEITDTGAVRVRTFGVNAPPNLTNVSNRTSLMLNLSADAVDISTNGVFKDQVVVVAKKTNGNLAVAVLDITNTGEIALREIVSEGQIHGLSVARMDRYNAFVVAVVDSVNELRLVSWGLTGTSALRRIGTNLWGGVASEVYLPRNQLGSKMVVLVKDENGNLRIALHYQNFQAVQ